MTDPRIERVARVRCIELGQDPDSFRNDPPFEDVRRTGPRWLDHVKDAKLFILSLDAATQGGRS